MRIHGLSQEYWRKKIIFAIASSVGTPICVDSVTSKPAIERTFGHYARVLVDLDVSNDLKYEVLVERKGFAFFVEFEYENLPEVCSFCKRIGHNASVCRIANKRVAAHKDKAHVPEAVGKQQHKDHAQQKQWTQKDNVVVDQENENSNRFAALLIEDNDEPADNTSPALAPEINDDSRTETVRNLQITQLEYVVEYDNDDGSSQDSDFVDATQRLETDPVIEKQAPVTVKQNIQFLNDAWANLEDVDAVQIRSQQQAYNDTIAAEADIDL